MLACELSASIFCARVMRGTSSIATALTSPSARRRTRSMSVQGDKRPINNVPGRSASSSSPPNSALTIGARTFKTTSADDQASRGFFAIDAPSASYSSSPMKAFSPAPASTTTFSPRATICLTVSGVAETRVSPSDRSFVTSTRTMVPRLSFNSVG